MPARPLSPDSTAAAYAIKAVLEIAAKWLVASILTWSGPDCPQPSDESGNPVGSLKCLIAVALQMERWLDERPARFVPVHGARCRGDQCGALIVFIENQEKAPSGSQSCSQKSSIRLIASTNTLL